MPIKIPNPDKVRPTTTPMASIPNALKTATVNPCPMRVSPTGAASSRVPLVEPTNDATGAGYIGFNVRSNAPVGASPDDEQAGIIRGAIVDGFTGVSPGVDVFIDPTARPDPESDFSGLTHTNTGGTSRKIGVGATTTKIWFD